MKDPIGLAFIPLATFLFYRGVQGLREGRISWLGGSEEFWMAHREDDPISFTTGVSLHFMTGAMALWMTYWVAFR